MLNRSSNLLFNSNTISSTRGLNSGDEAKTTIELVHQSVTSVCSFPPGPSETGCLLLANRKLNTELNPCHNVEACDKLCSLKSVMR